MIPHTKKYKGANFHKNWSYKTQVSKVNFLSDKKIYNAKKTFSNYKIKIRIKTTTKTGLNNELKYSPMSEGNACIAEPNLEVLPLRIIQ